MISVYSIFPICWRISCSTFAANPTNNEIWNKKKSSC